MKLYTTFAPLLDWSDEKRTRIVRVVRRWKGQGPRNVLVEDQFGCGFGQGKERFWVRPFRGMRRLPSEFDPSLLDRAESIFIWPKKKECADRACKIIPELVIALRAMIEKTIQGDLFDD